MTEPTPPDAGPTMKRRPQRRDRILREAISMFAERGFANAGMDEIGEAAGITGPGVYRHFANKQHILAEAVRVAADRLLERTREIVDGSADPATALRGLVAHLSRAAVEHPDLLGVLTRERHHLDDVTRAAMERAYESYVDAWVSTLSSQRPDFTEAEARLAVLATTSMALNAAPFDSDLPDDRISEMLREMMLRALGVAG